MGCAENEETKSASSPSLSFPSVEGCIWVDAICPPTTSVEQSPCIVTTTSNQNLAELSNCTVLALPTSHQAVVELNLLDACAAHQSLSVSDQTAIAHVTNTYAMQFGCLGNAASHALPWSSSVMSTATSSAPKASPTEFMQIFVNTLLPQLKRIHSQSSSISLQEKFPAVKLAADMSLAISAGGNSTWSQALFQELANSFSNKVGVRENKSRTLRGRIYTSILRRNSLRGGSHAMRMRARSQASSCKGANSLAFTSTARDRYQASLSSSARRSHECLSGSELSGSFSGGSSHAMCCRKRCNVHRPRRTISQRHFSYVKILRNSRSALNLPSVNSSADPGHEASKAHVPSISKEHIASLSRLVPGGRTMDVPLLFQEAADYILSLQMQVEVLQSLSHSV